MSSQSISKMDSTKNESASETGPHRAMRITAWTLVALVAVSVLIVIVNPSATQCFKTAIKQQVAPQTEDEELRTATTTTTFVDTKLDPNVPRFSMFHAGYCLSCRSTLPLILAYAEESAPIGYNFVSVDCEKFIVKDPRMARIPKYLFQTCSTDEGELFNPRPWTVEAWDQWVREKLAQQQ